MKIVKAGEVLVEEGDINNEIFVLLSGKLAVYKSDMLLVEYNKKGIVVGEMSAILSKPRSATVKAVTDCLVINLPGQIDKLLEDHTEIAKKIMYNLAEKLRETTDDYFILASEVSAPKDEL